MILCNYLFVWMIICYRDNYLQLFVIIIKIYNQYYAPNKEAMKEKSRECYKNLSQEKKNKIKKYQRKEYQELVQYKKDALKNN